jgi:dTDP-4-amino-4,6-dideoxygalactose transaminase
VSSISRYKIPIVDLSAQYVKIREEVRKAIDEVADSQQFILGPALPLYPELTTNQQEIVVEKVQAFYRR